MFQQDDDVSELVRGRNGRVIGRPPHPLKRRCLIRQHLTSDPFGLDADYNGQVTYSCYDKSCGNRRVIVEASVCPYVCFEKKPWHTGLGKFVGKTESQDQNFWKPGVLVEDLVIAEKGMPAIIPKVGKKCYCIKAPMNAGKTYQSEAWIGNLPRDVNILIVSCRIAFSQSQIKSYKDFGITHYHEGTFALMKRSTSRVGLPLRVIVQRIAPSSYGAAFEYILLDESQSLVSNMCSVSTNLHGKLRDNYEALRLFLQSSRLTVCMDDGAVVSLLQSQVLLLFKPEEVEVHRYQINSRSFPRH